MSRLAERWKWDRETVRRFLELLASLKMCHIKSSKICSIISIVNYNLYQGDATTDATTEPTKEPHQNRIRCHANKNDNKDKNELYAKFWGFYPSRNGKKVGKEETEKRFILLSDEDQKSAIVAVTNYAASTQYPVDPIRFFKSREYPNGLWREWIAPDVQTSHGHGDDGGRPAADNNMVDRIKELEKEMTSHE